MLFERLLKIIKANLVAKERNSSQDQYTSTGQAHYKQKEPYTHSPSSSDSKEKVYYEALEIFPPATFEQIKMAYKKLVKKYHPDLFHNDPQKRQYAEIVTQKINEAYAYFENKAEK